jgi:hypothetical protein
LDWVGILHSLHLIHGDEEMVIFWAWLEFAVHRNEIIHSPVYDSWSVHMIQRWHQLSHESACLGLTNAITENIVNIFLSTIAWIWFVCYDNSIGKIANIRVIKF